ncbi:Mrr restriction system protein [Limosilactobacillus reuteri]|nr:restriction endonuclease [Limosilactobacillus reuteri]MDW5472794.1 restriction endonuclease [Limosilactobacillus reuteri]PIN31280.1 restriction endonuclease [Limosilactobacillus reuteri]PUH36305.1 Mrr restriction system protein [Limosilactobacillus reuteri]PUH36528.1 Mrr restriction system protein [Limosilactobacillus reuteri]UZM90711.1 Mrr restriction system protein [Limosilactobacillus reuteri]
MANRQINIENLTMNEILKSMHRLGGQVTRKEIRQDIHDNSNAISEDEVDKIKVSKKTGNKYSPFAWTLNYAVKYLIMTGYLTQDGRLLELSEKGRNVDLSSFDGARDVRPVVEKMISKQKQNKASVPEKTNIEDSDDSDEIEAPWRQQLLDALMKMNPKKFELFCRGLLTKMGIDVDDEKGAQYVADGGIDGFGYVRSDDYRTTRVALQAKRWQGKVSAPEIDKFRGAMDKFNAEFGIFITNSDFTREAVRTAREGTRIITLINGDQVCDLVAKYNYYVDPVTTYRLKDFYLDKD